MRALLTFTGVGVRLATLGSEFRKCPALQRCFLGCFSKACAAEMKTDRIVAIKNLKLQALHVALLVAKQCVGSNAEGIGRITVDCE